MINDDQIELKKIAKGSGTILIGQFVGFFLQFGCGIIVIRYLSKSEYGLLSLSLTIINILVIFACFGLGDALPRMLSKYLSAGDYGRVRGIIDSSFVIVTAIGLFLCCCLFLWADRVSVLFSKADLAGALRLLCFMIPAWGFINLMVGIFRGFETAVPKVLFQDIVLPVLRLAAYLLIIYGGFGFNGILNAQLFVFYTTCGLFFAYAFKRLPEVIRNTPRTRVTQPLLQLSMPLLGMTILTMFAIWITPLFLGYFMASEFVGMYSAAMRLVNFLPIPLQATAFIYLPIATGLYSTGESERLRSLYVSATKWTCLITMPVAFVLIFDAEFALNLLFGSRYVPAANTLRILGAGFLFHTILGPNAMTLLACGKTKPMLLASFVAAALNCILCFLLIPSRGIIGAAMAVSLSLMILNVIFSVSLYKNHAIHPFIKNYIKPLGLTIGVMTCIIVLFQFIAPSGIIFRIVFYFLLTLFALSSPFLTNSIDYVSILLIPSFERKLFPTCKTFLRNWFA